MNQNTDLKDLFVKQNYEEMLQILDGMEKEEVVELTCYNCDVVKKYYDSERFDLIRQYLTFVAFCSFIFEYSVKNGLLFEAQYEEYNTLFEKIFEMLKA